MNRRLRRYVPALTIGGIVCAVVVGLVALLANLAKDDGKPHKKVVQVQVFRPPPPPPPDVEPPPPEVEEEVDIPEPEPVVEAPDVPDMPPGEQLGLDAEGVAGGDSFGLVGRKGGRDLLAGGSRNQWYAGRIKDQLLDYLASREDVRASSYSVVVHVWIQQDGRLGRYRLENSTGDVNLDRALAHALDDLGRFEEPPPSDMPQPVRLRIVSRV
jgi:protein TonB